MNCHQGVARSMRTWKEARDCDGDHMGWISYVFPQTTPNWSMMVRCKYHGCKVSKQARQHPSERGALLWLQTGRHMYATKEEHMQCFNQLVLGKEA